VRQAAIAVSGVLLGAIVVPLLGACGGYFECKTIDHPLTPGTYVMVGRTDYALVLDANGGAVETFKDGVDEIRTEYSMGEAVAVH